MKTIILTVPTKWLELLRVWLRPQPRPHSPPPTPHRQISPTMKTITPAAYQSARVNGAN